MFPVTARAASAAARFVEVLHDGVRWQIDAGWRDAVLHGIVQRLHAIENGGATLVKRQRKRAVYRVDLEEVAARVYLKVHRTPSALDRLKSVCLPTRASTEWRMMALFRRSGIPTARPLAYGERRVRGALVAAYLVTEEIPAVTDLVPFLHAAFTAPLRGPARRRKRLFLGRLARHVREMHERGIFYSDLHSGNILVQGVEPEEACFYFIDLHTGRRRRRLDSRSRLRNLARLGHSLLEVTSRTDRLRFFIDYAGADAALGPAIRASFAEGEARLAGLERRRLRSRARRCVVDSSRFARLDGPGLRGHALRELPASMWHEVVAGHELALSGGPGRVYKLGRSTRVTGLSVKAAAGADREEPVCVKEFRCPSPLDRLKRALGYRKARRAWLAGNALRVWGVPVAEPLAYLRGAGSAGSDLLVVRDVSQLRRLDHHVFEELAGAPSLARRRLAGEVASFVAGLHRRGVYHNDLKACNVLVSGAPGRREFVLVDFDGARCSTSPVGERRRIKNLAQLSASIPSFVSLTERFRFFRDYSQGRLSRGERRRYYRGVIRACRRKILVRERPIE